MIFSSNESGASTESGPAYSELLKMGKNDENEQNFEIWTSGCFSARKMLIFEGSNAKSQIFFKKCQKWPKNGQK